MREPRAFDADDPDVKAPEPAAAPVPPAAGDGPAGPASLPAADVAAASPVGRTFGWGGVLVGALVSLMLLAAGLWVERFVSVALAREDWLGWVALGLAWIAGGAALILVLKEIWGTLRLAQIAAIRRKAEAALATRDKRLEAQVAKRLRGLFSGRHEHAWDLQRFREEERHMRRPGELIGLADRVLMSTSDKLARRAIFESSRRVAVVTAMVPIAGLIVVFIAVETVRMIRRVAEAYGGRPGLVGGVRLAWRVLGHLAATGLVAFTDDLWGQFLGQDILRRLSRRAGEGTFNGALTARLGCAAADLCRPLPFVEAPRLRARDILAELIPSIDVAGLATRMTGRQEK